MPAWLHRTTKDYLRSVASADLPEPTGNYIEEPDLSGVAGVPSKYWNINGDVVSEMSPVEKQAVDDAEAAALVTDNRTFNVDEPDSEQAEGMRVRSLIQLLNKRDNYLTNRIIELQNRVQAMLDSNGNVANMRTDGLAVSISPTTTRTRADAVQDYRDDINAGVND